MSTITLTRSFFTKFNIEANSEFKPVDLSDIQISTDYKIELFKHNNDETKFQLIFTLAKIEAEAALPYLINIQMVGLFEAEPELLKSKPRLLEINGSSILYSSIREQVLTFTGRSIWGAFTLPTIDMREGFLNQPVSEQES